MATASLRSGGANLASAQPSLPADMDEAGVLPDHPVETSSKDRAR